MRQAYTDRTDEDFEVGGCEGCRGGIWKCGGGVKIGEEKQVGRGDKHIQ